MVAFVVLAFAGRVDDTNTRALLPLWLMLTMPIALLVSESKVRSATS